VRVRTLGDRRACRVVALGRRRDPPRPRPRCPAPRAEPPMQRDPPQRSNAPARCAPPVFGRHPIYAKAAEGVYKGRDPGSGASWGSAIARSRAGRGAPAHTRFDAHPGGARRRGEHRCTSGTGSSLRRLEALRDRPHDGQARWRRRSSPRPTGHARVPPNTAAASIDALLSRGCSDDDSWLAAAGDDRARHSVRPVARCGNGDSHAGRWSRPSNARKGPRIRGRRPGSAVGKNAVPGGIKTISRAGLFWNGRWTH